MKCFPVAEMTSKDYLTSVVVIRFGEGHIDAIISKVGRIAPEEVLLHFITAKCLPVLLYSLEIMRCVTCGH